MWIERSEEFRVLDDADVPADEPLVVHDGGREPSRLVVFVHGLGGSRYGTWGDFPRFVFEDFRDAGVAVGLYGYRTAAGRLRRSSSLDLEREATILADTVRDLPSTCQRVIIVAHSMGGLLAKAAIKSLIERHERGALARIAGLVLMATPQAGSLRVPSFLAWFSRDAAALEAHGDLVTRITEAFTDRVSQVPVPGDADRFVIPTWAVIAPADQWVDRLSAGLQIPSPRRKEVRGSHTSIVKPRDRTGSAYTFVRNALAECITEIPPPPAHEDQTPPVPGDGDRRAIQLTRLSISLPVDGGLTPQVASQLNQLGLPVSWPVAGQSPDALMQEAQPKPDAAELFEIVTDPDDVSRALYRTERTSGLAPYDGDYVNAREGVPDIQEALQGALRTSKDRLLVVGLTGMGKTREVAELARAACATKWTVLVARNEGNSRLGPLREMPAELIDARLLIVIDNLHARVRAGTEPSTPPYVERLERLLDWFEYRLPGRVRVLATAHDEPRFQGHLDLAPDADRWRGFRVFRLPRLTDDGLGRVLTTLAARSNVAVADDDVATLIANSDRRPGTVFTNVYEAHHRQRALDRDVWKPTEGESWRLRFLGVRENHAGVERVCQALQVLGDASLPARVPYVSAVARGFGVPNPEDVVTALVGEGLLGMRNGVVTPFSADQLEEWLREAGAPAGTIRESADVIERAITDEKTRPAEWAEDVLALALSLDRAGERERGEQVASRAIDVGAGGSRAYRIRAGIRFGRRNLPGVEADLAQSLLSGGPDADTHFMRATVRNLLGNHAGALEDLDLAVQHGRDDSDVHVQRGTAYYRLGQWPDAEAALSAAMARGAESGSMYFMRGTARLQLQDVAGADEDFSAAIERGTDLDDATSKILEFDDVAAGSPTDAAAAGLDAGTLVAYALRGFVRFKRESYPAAEEDLTRAIAGGASERFATFTDTLRGSSLPMLAGVTEELNATPAAFAGALYHVRGLARLGQDNYSEAEADFDGALERGAADAEIYFGRGFARLKRQEFAGADHDLTEAIDRGRGDAFTHTYRAQARLELQRFSEAEQDCTRAIDLGRDDGVAFLCRGIARMHQQALAAAEEDLSAAAERGPHHALATFTRGCVRFDQGKHAEAEQDLTAALALGFDTPALFTLRGLARATQDKLAEAAEDAAAAFARGAADAQAYSLRAVTHIAEDRHADAESDLTAAIDLGRRDTWVFFHRGRMRLLQEKWAEADEDFTAAIEAGLDDAEVRFLRGRARQRLGRDVEAESDFDEAIARGGQWQVRAARGYLRLIRGRFEDAKEDFDDLIAQQPFDTNAHFARGLARYALRDHAGALADLDAALTDAPGEAEWMVTRVLARLRLGDLDGAASDCARLEAIDPESPATIGCRGLRRLWQGDVEGALSSFAAAAQPGSMWCFWQGVACLLTGRVAEARTAYEEGATESAPADLVMALDELDFHLARVTDRPDSPETEQAVAEIRQVLREQADRSAGQSP